MNNVKTAICPDCGQSFDPTHDRKRGLLGSTTPGACPNCKDPLTLNLQGLGRPNLTTMCGDCGTGISFSPTYEPGSGGVISNKPEFCDACRQIRTDQLAREAWQELEETRQALTGEQFWCRDDPVITPLMRATDIADSRFNLRAWKEGVEPWLPSDDTPTLGMWGHTGTCKSRMGLLKLRQLLMLQAKEDTKYRDVITYSDGLIPREYWDSELRKYAQRIQVQAVIIKGERLGQLLGHIPFENENNRVQKLWELARVKYLFIDEVGKSAEKATQLPRLKLLIEHRMEHGLCTIWTANSSPEQFLAHGGAEYCLPLARRLSGENTRTVVLNSPQLAESASH